MFDEKLFGAHPYAEGRIEISRLMAVPHPDLHDAYKILRHKKESVKETIKFLKMARILNKPRSYIELLEDRIADGAEWLRGFRQGLVQRDRQLGWPSFAPKSTLNK